MRLEPVCAPAAIAIRNLAWGDPPLLTAQVTVTPPAGPAFTARRPVTLKP